MNSTSGALRPANIQKKIASGNFSDALQDIDSLLTTNPDDAEALYMAAVCYRYKKDFAQAQGCLDTLKSLSSDKGRTYQEQGHLYRAQNLLAQALTAFQQLQSN